MSDPLLAAVLIVKNEQESLPGCLASLAGVVDEIVIYDTGSHDDSVAVARRAGAVVHEGFWDDDFSRARNVGLDLARSPWVLVVDADERVAPGSDRAALRALLVATRADVLTVSVRNVSPEEFGGSYRHPGPRLLRREHVRYRGRVHEQPVSAQGGTPAPCPADLLRIEHLGYADPAVVRAKAERNAALATAALNASAAPNGAAVPNGAGDARARTAQAEALLALGRSLVVLGRREEAAQALGRVREIVPATRRAVEATDALARVLLALGRDREVLDLAEELRRAGTDGRYCDWLRAQAQAQLGAVGEALALLRRIDRLVDPAGRELDLGQVLEIRALVASLTGDRDEAARCLVEAMLSYGRVGGRAALLLDLWGSRPPDDLVTLLCDALPHADVPRQPGAPRPESGAPRPESGALARLVAELASCRDPGPAVAARLGARSNDRSVSHSDSRSPVDQPMGRPTPQPRRSIPLPRA